MVLISGQAWGAREFVDVSSDAQIQPYIAPKGLGAGAAAADYDDDGDIDIFVLNDVQIADQLYQNQGNGTFLEIASQVGLAALSLNKVAIWFDVDNDNRLDLLVARDCYAEQVDCGGCLNSPMFVFYRQLPSGQFVDQTIVAGFGVDTINSCAMHRGGLAAGDINNDGYLDVITSVWGGNAQLFLNLGNGTFCDISISSNLGAFPYRILQPIMYDFNRDGFLDIYTTVDIFENHLWINGQDNTFQNVALAAGVNNAMNDMGIALADYDNDGDMDIYITNITSDFEPPAKYNILYRNDSSSQSLAFADVSLAAGPARGGWGWGCTWIDMDNNGWLDIAATNGFGSAYDTSVFYRNTCGNPALFTDVSDEVGFNDDLWGSALLALDYNRDGFPDLVQVATGHNPITPLHALRVLENRKFDPNQLDNNYLVVKPRMCDINRRAIGATVHVTAGGLTMTRLISAGCSFYGQEPAEACFGLGQANIADSVVVDWPSGAGTTVITDVAVNQVVTVAKEARSDFDGSGKTDLKDFAAISGQWMQIGSQLATDMNGDDLVDSSDFQHFVRLWLIDCP
jgi:hypothetical protein